MMERSSEETSASLDNLTQRIARLTEHGELHTTAIPGLGLYRRTEPSEPVTGMYEPSICLVAQGAKQVRLGDDSYIYNAQNYLITSVHLPTTVQVIEASVEKPTSVCGCASTCARSPS